MKLDSKQKNKPASAAAPTDAPPTSASSNAQPAHEAQNAKPGAASGAKAAVNDDPALEKEADVMGAKAVANAT